MEEKEAATECIKQTGGDKDFIGGQVKNSLCFECEGVTIKVNYASEGKTFEEVLKEHFIKFRGQGHG